MVGNPILDAVFHSWRMSVVTTASRLEIFSHLEGGGLDAAVLARKTHSVPHLLEALLDAGVAMGLLVREGNAYRNSHISSAYLVPERPLYVGHILEIQSRGAARWNQLQHMVTTGEAPEGEGELGEQHATFTRAMNDLGMLGEASALASAVDLSGCKTLVELGCGSGLYSITLCQHNPKLEATLVDLEPVLPTTKQFISKSGVSDRIRTREGNLVTDTIGENIDAVLFSDSLYYDEDKTLGILKTAHKALAPGGQIILRGYYADPGGSETLFGAVFKLNLLFFDPNRKAPNVNDLKAWLGQAGFKKPQAIPITEQSVCLVGTK